MAWQRAFRIDSRDRWRSILRALADMTFDPAREPVDLIVRSAREEKSAAMRNYWHAVLSEFGRAVGYAKDEIKQAVKAEFYGTKTVRFPDGRAREVVPSSESSDREEYGELIDFTIRLAAEMGVTLSDPRPK